MRQLSYMVSRCVKVGTIDLDELKARILSLAEYIREIFVKYGANGIIYNKDPNYLDPPLDIRFRELEIIESSVQEFLHPTDNNNLEILNNYLENWSHYRDIEHILHSSGGVVRVPFEEKSKIGKYICETSKELLDDIKKIPKYNKTLATSKSVYLPSLRGLRPLDDTHSDVYKKRTFEDYFSHEGINPPEIFTGLNLYKEITELLLGRNSERQSMSRYQEFITDTLFEGKPVQLIPSLKDKVITVKIGKEEDRPIHHLGDGIQSAIILSFLPFTRQEPTFFFIEEPEMYMHPGLQRKLLKFFSTCEQHTFFLTTHSNHFLDLTIDFKNVSVFTFTKVFNESDEDEIIPNFKIEAVDSEYESSLELLGVRNSSVFLVNATIWLEGITDRWYLREMLNSYMSYLEKSNNLHFKAEEDTHYSFVEYGGANITHWSFLDYEKHPIEVSRLCAKAIVIIDKDGEKKETRKEDLKEKLGNRLIILPCREIENILPPILIKKVIAEYEKDESIEFRNFKQDDYKDKYLGTFIESKIFKTPFSRKGGYKADSGTIKDKLGFCEKALSKIKYEELSEEAKRIIENIYNFICKQNS